MDYTSALSALVQAVANRTGTFVTFQPDYVELWPQWDPQGERFVWVRKNPNGPRSGLEGEVVTPADLKKWADAAAVKLPGRSQLLEESDHAKFDTWLRAILRSLQSGTETEDSVVAAVGHVVAAIDLGNMAEARKWIDGSNGVPAGYKCP